jgi:hypothetical protein
LLLLLMVPLLLLLCCCYCCCYRVYGLVLPPLDAALEAVKSHLGPGQGLDAVKVATSMANR